LGENYTLRFVLVDDDIMFVGRESGGAMRVELVGFGFLTSSIDDVVDAILITS
jgi:hypothetical protein